MKPSEVIMERGWIQAGSSRPEGVCMLQAICIAVHDGDACDDSCERFFIPFEDAVPDKDAIGWNDAPGRTIEQVIALLREFETEFESDTTRPAELVAVT